LPPSPNHGDAAPGAADTRSASALGIDAEALGARLSPLLVAALKVAETVSPGEHGRRRVGQGDSFWQFRPYQMGDTIEKIDWRQSAKGDRLYIRQTEWAAAQSVFLWRDAGAGMEYASDRRFPTKRNRAELLLLAAAALLLRGGEKVALMGGGRPPATGRGVLAALLAGLDKTGAEMRSIDSAGTPAPRHATLIAFSDFLEPIDEITAALDRAASAGVTACLVQVLDPAEIALPFAGRVRFREMRPGAPLSGDILTPRVEAVRDAYRQALDRQQQALAALAASRGWRFLTHSTGEAPEIPLRSIYADLSGRAGDERP
jgi:uncharacterized protein (DUF58 family)